MGFYHNLKSTRNSQTQFAQNENFSPKKLICKVKFWNEHNRDGLSGFVTDSGGFRVKQFKHYTWHSVSC